MAHAAGPKPMHPSDPRLQAGMYGGKQGGTRFICYKKLEDALPLPDYSHRPAKRQIDRPLGPKAWGGTEDTGGDYNIWYDKYCGGREFRNQPKKLLKAQTKCFVKTDSGGTRGDKSDCRTCCIYFAKGCCSQGPNCQYLHRIPTPFDEDRLNLVNDIFGRDRFKDDRHDMGGVGSFGRDLVASKTLYVNYGSTAHLGAARVKEMVAESFGEFGPLHNVYVITSKGIAFVRFHMRSTAEFAKEAMSNQSLRGSKGGEILEVKWAHDDPNFNTQETVKKETLKAATKAVRESVARAPEHIRQMLDQRKEMSEHPLAYPNTDAQYGIPADPYQNLGAPGQGHYPGGQYPGGGGADMAYPNTDHQFAAAAAVGDMWNPGPAPGPARGGAGGGHVHGPGLAPPAMPPGGFPGVYPGAAPGAVMEAGAAAGAAAARAAVEERLRSGALLVAEDEHVYDVDDFPVFVPEEVSEGEGEGEAAEPAVKKPRLGAGSGGGEEMAAPPAGGPGALSLLAGYGDDSDSD